MQHSPITTASVSFEDATPVSAQFGDVYFSKAGGVEESTYVFLHSNGLPTRFAAAVNGFHIAETGFGTGLNFLLTMRLWCECAPKDAVLHYTSIERHPIAHETLSAIYAPHPLSHEADMLLEQYPPLQAGTYALTFAEGRVQLTLHYADVEVAVQYLPAASVDAWFLDGFAPAKNPDMWTEFVLMAVGQATKLGGSCATFTAAGEVRRLLTRAGFTMEKQAGFGHKREMLSGWKPAESMVSVPVKPARKARLNDALRANLGRRKAAPKAGLHRPVKGMDAP
jgi:tRNA 5-methylaminomethyl-2-thiouridine biosynthesis bifunctional protein